MKVNKLWLALALPFLFACSQKHALLTPQEYVQFVLNQNNGFRKSKEIGELRFELQKKPTQFILAREMTKVSLNAESVRARTEELNGLDYYDFRIKVTGTSENILKYGIAGSAEYFNRLDYFSYKMKDDLQIIRGKTTYNCVLFNYERQYDLTNTLSFILAFPKCNGACSGVETFVFDDQILGVGKVKIQLTIPEHLPELKV